jgi:hypothetical protein
MKYMRKVVLLAVAVAFLVGCSKKVEEEEPRSTYPTEVELELDRLGVYPSGRDDITYIGVKIDSANYKIVGGAKLDKYAWLAKFDSDGTEVFSFKLDNVATSTLPYSYCGPVVIDGNLLFVAVWTADGPGALAIKSESVLIVFDFLTGKEIHRLPPAESGIYAIVTTPYSYLVEETRRVNGDYFVVKFHAIGFDGNHLWSRQTTTAESSGLKAYGNNYFFLSEEVIIFKPYDRDSNPNSSVDSDVAYRVINLKGYILKFDVPVDEVIFIGDNVHVSGVSYRQDSVYMIDGNIRIQYGEYMERIVIDDALLGTSHMVHDLQGLYFYDLDATTGKVLAQGKLS